MLREGGQAGSVGKLRVSSSAFLSGSGSPGAAASPFLHLAMAVEDFLPLTWSFQ